MATNDPNKKTQSDMPPVPRDYHEASHSELLPFKSKSINLLKSPLFYMVMLTAFAALAFFNYFQDVLKGSASAFYYIVYAVLLYMLGLVSLIVYLYSKTDRPYWHFLSNTVFISTLLLVPALSIIYFYVFRSILPGGQAMTQSNTFINSWIGMFFGAGLMEELMKVTLVLFGAYIAFNAERWRQRLPGKLFDMLQIRGPLDGLLMGLFGGAGFILIETGAQYVPQIAAEIGKTAGGGGGMAAGLMLLMPRVVGGMVGHMAWAGITGYFIGLAVIRPALAMKFVLFAWLGTSALHATWNTQQFFPAFGYISALVSGAFLVACLLKARQLEMSMGRSLDTYGSVVVEPKPAPAPAPSATASPPAPVSAPASSPAPVPGVAAAAPAAPTVAPALSLALRGSLVALAAGARFDLGQLAHLAGAGAGVVGEVTRHPTRADVLGLKNLGAASWTAHLRDGTQQEVGAQRNLRLAPGVRIDFGNGLQGEVIAQ